MDKVIRLFGLTEAEIISKLSESGLDAQGFGIAEDALDGAIAAFGDCLPDGVLDEYIYSRRGKTLEEEIFALLEETGLTLSVAESLTGGMVCDRLINVAGISSHFFEGIVAYANEAKILRLGVQAQTLATRGAVSSDTAGEMAEGLIRAGASVAISTTGVAGPSGGSAEKPVGLVYFGFATKNTVFTKKQIFNGNRFEIRKKSTNYALFNLFLLLRAFKNKEII